LGRGLLHHAARNGCGERRCPADIELTRQAAGLKARGGIAYADCFAGALAKTRNLQLMTGDIEFKRLQDVVKILWID
jgi:predicted nucleic acid-binding protein